MKFVATKVPTSISEGMSFVVNLDCLEAQEDVVADDMRVWRNNGVNLTRVCVAFQNSCPMEIKKLSFKDVHSANATDQSLRKITAFVFGE